MKQRENAAPVAMRADVAELVENFKSYFRRAGLFGRLLATVARTLFYSVIAYAAMSGILPTYVLWVVNFGDVSAEQAMAEIAANPEIVSRVLVKFHEAALGVAACVACLVACKDVLYPRRALHVGAR